MIARLQYITQDIEGKSHSKLVEDACLGGVEWVQLRMKNASKSEIEQEAMKVRSICRRYGAKFIINDYPDLAVKVRADGVHLGKNDMPLSKVREVIGSKMILGATCNTFEDIQNAVQHQIDYVGVGPFRHTTTKKELSPVLGLDGYRKIADALARAEIVVPLIAIGGIESTDISALRKVGVDGIAVASIINRAKNLELVIGGLMKELTREI